MVTCNPNQADSTIDNEGEFDSNSCTNTVKMTSKYACKGSKFIAWYKIVGVNKMIIGALLGVCGLFLVFLGNTYFKFCSSLIIAVCSGLILKSLLAPFVEISWPISFGLGIIVAIIIYNLIEFLTTVLSIIIGYFVGNIVYNFVVTWFTGVDPNTLYFTVLIVCIILVLILAYLIKSIIIIVATSLVGSYVAVRGLSICFGGFPDETYTSRLIMAMEFQQLSRIFNGKAKIYLIGILCVFAVGLIVQGATAISGDDKKEGGEKHHKEEEKEKLLEKENNDA